MPEQYCNFIVPDTFHQKIFMKKILLLGALFVFTGLSAQKTIRDANAVSRNAKNFHAIEISDGIDLYLTQSGEEAVAVSASANEYRDNIVTEVVNGVLKIYNAKRSSWGFNWSNRKLKAYVSARNIDNLSAGGGSDVYIDSELKTARLSMHLSGGSDFRGKIRASDLSIAASGGSDVYISGETDLLKINASGGSDVHGYDLISNTCDIESSGGSDVRITVNKQLNANSSGGSDIYYKGNATSNTKKSGGGSVKKMG